MLLLNTIHLPTNPKCCPWPQEIIPFVFENGSVAIQHDSTSLEGDFLPSLTGVFLLAHILPSAGENNSVILCLNPFFTCFGLAMCLKMTHKVDPFCACLHQ